MIRTTISSFLCSNFSSYLKYMLGVDIKTNGFLSALPFLCRYVGGLLHGKISDELYERKVLRLVTVRRLFNSISKASSIYLSLDLSLSNTENSL